MSNITYKEAAPIAQEFVELRHKIGWSKVDIAMAQTSLDNSLYHICAYEEQKLIGMGRVIGDGAMFFYIQDLVVDPEFQNRGMGRELMNYIEQFISINAKLGSTVGLLAAAGKEEFYTKFDYLKRTGSPLGLGMCKFIK